jgi:hypothetical protein
MGNFDLPSREPAIVQQLKEQREEVRQEEEKRKVQKEFEDIELNKRFNEQCYLMHFWRQFTDYNKRKSNFESIRALEHDKPFELNNILFDRGGKLDTLFNLRQDQLSLLVPKIRIFKIYPAFKGLANQKGRSQDIVIELPFDDHLNQFDIENITKNQEGRGGGAGIKFFEWASLGTNPADKFVFGAKLSLYFQSIDELFVVRKQTPDSYGNTIQTAYSDLLIHQKNTRESENIGSQIWNRHYYQIKAVVGWYVPRSVPGINEFLNQDVLDALENTSLSFNMTLKKHEIEVKEDGSIDLQIEYISSTEALMHDPIDGNVLFTNVGDKNKNRKLQELKTQLENDIEKKKKEKEKVESKKDNNSAQIKQLEKEIKQKEEELASATGNFKAIAYARIMFNMLTRNQVHSVFVSNDLFKKFLRTVRLTNANSPEEIKNRFDDLEAAAKKEGFEPFSADNNSLEKILNAATTNQTKSIKEKKDTDLVRDFYVVGATPITKLDLVKSETSKNHYRVNFVSLGSIIDAALDGLFDLNSGRSEFRSKELRVIVGPVRFYDYGKLSDGGVVTKLVGTEDSHKGIRVVYRGTPTSVNLADIPIALSVFQSWFLDNVIDKGRINYSFKDFVDELISDLAIRAMSGECYDFAPKQRIKLTYKTFSLVENEKTENLFKSTDRINLTDLSLQDARNQSEKKTGIFADSNNGSADTRKQVHNYLLIYGVGESPFDLKGDYIEDLKKGYYHLFFGNERGLVKNIKFKREDLPFIRESNFSNQLPERQVHSKILRDRYNADVELFGNNIFEVGQKIYIEPHKLGFAGAAGRTYIDDKDLGTLIRDLGIGGYYDIIKIENRIESGKFETSLSTRWTARGDGVIGNVGDLGDVKFLSNKERAKLPKNVKFEAALG